MLGSQGENAEAGEYPQGSFPDVSNVASFGAGASHSDELPANIEESIGKAIG